MSKTKPRIGIIGGGIGGCSSAYFLSNLFKNNIEIDIYEKSDIIGGRIASFEYDNRLYETGGTILHPKNLYMSEFLKICGLSRSADSNCTKTFFGLYASKGLVYENFGHYFSLIDKINFFKHFGFFQIFRFNYWISKFIDKFSKIYDLQNDAFTFQTIEEFLNKLDPMFLSISQNSMRTFLKSENLSDIFIEQLASAACLVNYNQPIDIQGFVGIVSLAGAYANLWNVRSKGGNKEIPQNLAELSGAKINLNTLVTSIKQDDIDKNLTNIKYVQNGEEFTKEYDYIIIAFPMTKNLKKFHLGFNFNNENYEMQLTKTYFIEGNVHLYPQIPLNRRVELLSCDDNIDYRSICVQLPCDYNDKNDSNLWLNDKKKLYKVFSKVDLNDETLRKIFIDDYEIKKQIDWYAYPKYNIHEKLSNFPSIILDSNERSRVYYLNSIEWSASCMEMSCIAARNIALLISKKEQTIDKTKKLNKKICSKSILDFFGNYFEMISIIISIFMIFVFYFSY